MSATPASPGVDADADADGNAETSAPDAEAATSAESPLTDKQHRILAYLREHAATQTYFKSRLIGEDLDLSAKEVGTNMTALQENDVGLTVEKWGYSSSTTWKVTT